MLVEAGIETTQPHSIRSASSSKSVQLKEPLDSVMTRCGWSRQSTFFTHYLHPVTLGQKPDLAPLALTDLKSFYCPPKLLTDKSPAILDPNFILLSDVFVTLHAEPPSGPDTQFLPVLAFPPQPSRSEPQPESSTLQNNPEENLGEDPVIDLTIEQTSQQEAQSTPLPMTVLKTQSGTCVISQVPPTVSLVSTPTSTPAPAANPSTQLSPSNFLEMRNRTVLKRKPPTKLPNSLQPFKTKKLHALRSNLPWRPRGPRPIDRRQRKLKANHPFFLMTL